MIGNKIFKLSELDKVVPQALSHFACAIRNEGGTAFLVGGCVRDIFLGIPAKDFDVEVHGMSLDCIEKTLQDIQFNYSEVGKHFGILKATSPDKVDFDISIPRREKKSGIGHKDFTIEIDPNLTMKEACRRRDFTINALMLDMLTGEVHDFFYGMDDMQCNILRAVDPKTFVEDPLRAMRALQFVSRFNLNVHPDSFKVIQKIVKSGELNALPKERLQGEWKKLLLSKNPTAGLELAKKLGILAQLWPNLTTLSLIPQDPMHHPEGDVWQHTVLAVAAAAELLSSTTFTEEQKWVIMLSVLLHDLGKLNYTKIHFGKITAHEHEKSSIILARQFLDSIGASISIKDKVRCIIGEHMFPASIPAGKKPSAGAIRRLAARLHPATIEELAVVVNSDGLGRLQKIEDCLGNYLLEEAKELEVHVTKPKHAITGQEFLNMGVPQGKIIGRLIQIADGLHDMQGLTKEETIAKMEVDISAAKN